jgi:serine O-acetyltransferase
MNLSMPQAELKQYISRQLNNFFPDKYQFDGSDVDSAFDSALQRTEHCFKYISLPSYNDGDNVCFYHLHSDQYCSFLYFLANCLWIKSQNKPLCDKLFFLNKTLNSIFLSYKCKLPDIFVLWHPIGSVIGNAEYSDYLVIFQNVTVNTGYPIDVLGKNPPPKLGKGIFLGAGAKIVGSGRIGNFSSIGINSYVFKTDIPDNSIVFMGSDGKLNVKENKNACQAQTFFNVDITQKLKG